MLVERECFVAKPGLARKLAAQIKDAANETFRALMKGYTDLYITGSREIMQVT